MRKVQSGCPKRLFRSQKHKEGTTTPSVHSTPKLCSTPQLNAVDIVKDSLKLMDFDNAEDVEVFQENVHDKNGTTFSDRVSVNHAVWSEVQGASNFH